MTEQRELHPQYQALRAMADGWKIVDAKSGEEVRVFIPGYEHRIVPDSEGWIPYYAEEGKCPVDDIWVEVDCRNGLTEKGDCDFFCWDFCGENTITHYRIVEQDKQPSPAKVNPDVLQWAKRTLGQPQQYSDQRKAAREILRLAGENSHD